jgi:AcrR family transcriptional regulator
MPPARRPRQARAIETRRRVYEAAIAEFQRVGVEAARIDDIVSAAGVSWGTFFHYFPSKDEVILEAATVTCKAFAEACRKGTATGASTRRVVANAFRALRNTAPAPGPIRNAIMQSITNDPGRLADHLGEEIPNPVLALSQVLEIGQRRGEITAAEPAESLAAVLVHAVIASGQREAAVGRAAGVKGRAGLSLTVLAMDLLLRGMEPEQSSATSVKAEITSPSVHP